MLQEQIYLYLRENTMILAVSAGFVVLFLLLLVLIQVTRTRREVHKICNKIKKYFDVILSEDVQEPQPEHEAAEDVQIPVYKSSEERLKDQEEQKMAEDAKLLMDVISEVF